MKWLRRFRTVSAYLRRVREFNKTTVGTKVATTRKSAGYIYDHYGQEKGLDNLVAEMEKMGRRDREFLS